MKRFGVVYRVLCSSLVLSIFVVSCSESENQGANESAKLMLPVSINEVMVSLINHSADPIWIAAWRNPTTDKDWRELEHMAKQLQVGGALLSIPGTGPADELWTNREEWRQYAAQLSSAGERAVNAARSRDVELVARSGDEIVAVCESCHIEFKPDLPTMNIYGDLSPTANR